jgi:hypothetical protein
MDDGFPLFMRETARKLRAYMRLSKGIFLKLGLSFALSLCVLSALKLILKLESNQTRIRNSLSSALGMDVQFEKLRSSLFWKIRISGVKGSNASGARFSAHELQINPRLLSLLKGQLVLSEVRIDKPRLTWVDQTTPPAAPPAADSTATSAIKKETPSELPHLLKRLLPNQGVSPVRRLVINNGDLDWIDARGHTLIQVESVQLELNADPTGLGKGRIAIAKGAIAELIAFHGMQSPIELNGGLIKLPDIRATSGEGQIEASIGLQTRQPGLPINVKASLKAVDRANMTPELPSLRLAGIANGDIELAGLALQATSITGNAQLQIENGFFKGLSLLQLVGQILQINELSNLKIKTATARMAIADSNIQLNELSMQSEDLSFSAPGVIGFNRQLSLNASLSLPERMLNGKNIQPFNSRFSPADELGNRSINFAITGSLDKPRTNLLEKIAGDGVGNLFQQLIGNFLKPRQADKKPEPSPAANPPESTPK